MSLIPNSCLNKDENVSPMVSIQSCLSVKIFGKNTGKYLITNVSVCEDYTGGCTALCMCTRPDNTPLGHVIKTGYTADNYTRGGHIQVQILRVSFYKIFLC